MAILDDSPRGSPLPSVAFLLGVEDPDAEEQLLAVFELATAIGVDLQQVGPTVQAYARGVGRIVEAESVAYRRVLRAVPPPEREALLDRLMTMVRPLAVRGFDLLHESLLRAALSDDLVGDDTDETGNEPLAVALVDLSGSTAYLAQASDAESRALVDGLFEAGQAAVLRRHVRVAKHVGDGMFLVGRDVGDVADACFAALAHIDATLPLPARAGIAYGPVLRRSGDYFGLPVNLAQILTKVAGPTTVLATREAADHLPPAMCATDQSVPIPGTDQRAGVVVIGRDRRA